jgi:Zn-dependent protease
VPETLLNAVVLIPVLLLALSAHEAAHAWAALKLGDPTAHALGRSSLLPFKHIDPIGTLLLPGLLLLMQAPFLIGYAKPTPVDPGRFKDPKRGFSIVAVAGPGANFALAVGLSLLGWLLFIGLGIDDPALRLLLGAGIVVNALLGFLNLLPLPGFDGLKALYAFLPDAWCWRLQRAESFFVLVLVLAVWTRTLDLMLAPGFWLGQALCGAAGISGPLF